MINKNKTLRKLLGVYIYGSEGNLRFVFNTQCLLWPANNTHKKKNIMKRFLNNSTSKLYKLNIFLKSGNLFFHSSNGKSLHKFLIGEITVYNSVIPRVGPNI